MGLCLPRGVGGGPRCEPATLELVTLDRVSPLAVPVLLEMGRESVGGSADTALLIEAAALAAEAMRVD